MEFKLKKRKWDSLLANSDYEGQVAAQAKSQVPFRSKALKFNDEVEILLYHVISSSSGNGSTIQMGLRSKATSIASTFLTGRAHQTLRPVNPSRHSICNLQKIQYQHGTLKEKRDQIKSQPKPRIDKSPFSANSRLLTCLE